MLKRLVKNFLGTFGYELQHTGTSGWTPAHLRKLGFHPRTVVDVGVGFGTPILYEAFPESYHVLIEPLVEFGPHLQEILKNYDGQYFLTAVGANKGNQTINVESNYVTRSSIYKRASLTVTGDLVSQREIPVTTLDMLLEEHNFQPPFGLKIDTEGFELQVIKGASRFLREAEFVIAEVSVARRFEQSYSFADFVGVMDRSGFRLCDILAIDRGASRVEITLVDAVFKNMTFMDKGKYSMSQDW